MYKNKIENLTPISSLFLIKSLPKSDYRYLSFVQTFTLKQLKRLKDNLKYYVEGELYNSDLVHCYEVYSVYV